METQEIKEQVKENKINMDIKLYKFSEMFFDIVEDWEDEFTRKIKICFATNSKELK